MPNGKHTRLAQMEMAVQTLVLAAYARKYDVHPDPSNVVVITFPDVYEAAAFAKNFDYAVSEAGNFDVTMETHHVMFMHTPQTLVFTYH